MSNWIDKYKKLVISSHKKHIIVADTDNLFSYIELTEAFENEGYKILVADSDLNVRINYELYVRDFQGKYLIVAPPTYKPLPDIEMLVHFQVVGLSSLFPNLDSKAIKGLSFNALCLLSNIKPYEELSHTKTLKFLLENLYNVDFDTLTNNKARERILTALITVFLEKNGINKSLTEFLIGLSKPYFPELVSKGLTKTSLINFIQQQWQFYVNEEKCQLDFEEPLLNKSLGYLFVFEYVKPVKVSHEKYLKFPKPLKIGLFVDEIEHNDTELEGLVEYLNQQQGLVEDIPEQWFKLIQIFANAKLKFLLSENNSLKERYLKIETEYNTRFQRFIDNTYGSLFSLSGVRKPIVVSRILEHIKANPSKKKAIFVIDGMNYWQWILLSEELAKVNILCTSNASLAYIPTITAWSRQAIFKGDKPNLNEDNSNEKKLFETYWNKQSIAPFQIDMIKFGISEPTDSKNISEDTIILGIVCNDLDNIMHGATLGDVQLKTSTKQWIKKSKVIQFISELISLGFEIFITSDHGNVESAGIKNLKLKEKVGALSRSKRHLHFTNEMFAQEFLDKNINLVLGKKGLSVYLKNLEAFTLENKKIITHGGSHFWEVIVPFISINGK